MQFEETMKHDLQNMPPTDETFDFSKKATKTSTPCNNNLSSFLSGQKTDTQVITSQLANTTNIHNNRTASRPKFHLDLT